MCFIVPNDRGTEAVSEACCNNLPHACTEEEIGRVRLAEKVTDACCEDDHKCSREEDEKFKSCTVETCLRTRMEGMEDMDDTEWTVEGPAAEYMEDKEDFTEMV